jgi:hypothetical protein
MEDNERSITYGETYVAECAKDARADALVFGHTHWTATGGEYVGRYDYAEAGEVFRVKAEGESMLPARRVPAFGSDPAAARALLGAVPAEKRQAVVEALLARLAPDWEAFASALEQSGPTRQNSWDVLFLFLLAPPAAIRDAVLEAVEGREE